MISVRKESAGEDASNNEEKSNAIIAKKVIKGRKSMIKIPAKIVLLACSGYTLLSQGQSGLFEPPAAGGGEPRRPGPRDEGAATAHSSLSWCTQVRMKGVFLKLKK